jgi:endonuclease/exonuclease/phosphatase family metal-dependent hydrolase
MRLATFNIYWLGGNQVERTEEDEGLIARIIAKLEAGVLAFQEIMQGSALERVIERVNAETVRNYRIKNEAGSWLEGDSQGMRVMMAYDIDTMELLSDAAIKGGVERRPCALHLRDRSTGSELTVVGVHFQAGYPHFDGVDDANVRRHQCEHLVSWIAGGQQGANPGFPRPAGDDVVVLGDFNAINDLDVSEVAFHIEDPDVSYGSLAPLRTGDMADWHWPKPLADTEGGRFSVYEERLMIDFIMLSPSLAGRVVKEPRLYAFDRDPEIGASGVNLSDHRPVVVELAIGRSA